MSATIKHCDPHADGRTVIHVTQEYTDPAFTALYAAEDWCKANGISYGRLCGPGLPIGLMRGDFDIQKWRNLRQSERAALDGKMSGNFRSGPITIDLKGRQP